MGRSTWLMWWFPSWKGACYILAMEMTWQVCKEVSVRAFLAPRVGPSKGHSFLPPLDVVAWRSEDGGCCSHHATLKRQSEDKRQGTEEGGARDGQTVGTWWCHLAFNLFKPVTALLPNLREIINYPISKFLACFYDMAHIENDNACMVPWQRSSLRI